MFLQTEGISYMNVFLIALTDEERHERKRYSAALYQKYLNRSGPKHLGSKEIPEVSYWCILFSSQ